MDLEPQKKPNPFQAYFWWKLPEQELDKQISGYNTLKIHQSARGVSALLLLLAVVINILAVVFSLLSPESLIDAFLLLIFVPFVLKGYRWALIVVMIFWTVEKVLSLISNPGSVFISFIWWGLYMRSFYLAYKVEQLKRKETVINFIGNNSEELKKLQEMKNAGKLTEEDYTRLQKEIIAS